MRSRYANLKMAGRGCWVPGPSGRYAGASAAGHAPTATALTQQLLAIHCVAWCLHVLGAD